MTHKQLMTAIDKTLEKMNDLTACAKSVRRQLKKRRQRKE